MIAPDHGIIWRKDPGKIIQMYLDMAEGKAKLDVTIIYDTMWHSTEAMAQPIAKGVHDEGLDCKVVKLRASAQSVAIKEFWKSRGTLIGSPTLNNLSFPTIGQFHRIPPGFEAQEQDRGRFRELRMGRRCGQRDLRRGQETGPRSF